MSSEPDPQELVKLLDDPSSVEICHTKDGQHTRRYLSKDECELLYQAVVASSRHAYDIEPAVPSDDGLARIYLMAQRKCWHHDQFKGWTEAAWERFDYVECAIYTKPIDQLTDFDRDLIETFGERREGWIEPTPALLAKHGGTDV